MFVNFSIDNGIRFTAHFYDVKADSRTTRPVSGWVTGDDGVSQATVLVPEAGIQLRVGQFSDFLAVVPNGKEEEHETLLAAKVEELKKRANATTSPVAEA
jgi:hypothetical protein